MGNYMINSMLELVAQDRISFDKQGTKEFMQYQGTVEEVAETLKKALQKPARERDFNFFLYAPRLLIGVMDYGLRTRRNGNLLRLKQSIETLCLKAFEGDYQSITQDSLQFPEPLLKTEINEENDNISWSSFDPRYVRMLLKRMKKNPEKFIPDYVVLDGHNAYRPGFMLAAYLNSEVCAIKNPRNQKGERKPVLLRGEREELSKKFYQKNLMIFGENISTGEAIKSLYNLIMQISNPNQIRIATPLFIPGDHPIMPIDYYGIETAVFS